MGTASPGGAARGSPADDSGLGAASRTEGAEERARQAAAGRAGRAADPALRKRVAARPLARRKVWRAPAPPGEVAVGFVCLFFLFLPPSTPPGPPASPGAGSARRGNCEGSRNSGARRSPDPGGSGARSASPRAAAPVPGCARRRRAFSISFFFFLYFIFFFLPSEPLFFCPPASPFALIYASGERRPPAPPHRPAMSAAISAAEKVDGFTRKSVRKAQRQKRSQGSSQFRSQSSQVELSPLPQLKGTAVPPRPRSRTGAPGPFPHAFPRVLLLAHGLALAVRARAPLNERPAGLPSPAVPRAAPATSLHSSGSPRSERWLGRCCRRGLAAQNAEFRSEGIERYSPGASGGSSHGGFAKGTLCL